MVQIKQMLVPASRAALVRYTGTNTKVKIVVHQTGNVSHGANAFMHARLQYNGNSRAASWHITVDDKVAYQSFSYDDRLWHAGNARINQNSIGVEICVNADGNYTQAVKNGVEVVKYLMDRFNISEVEVINHHDASGKYCPTQLLNGKNGLTWSWFKKALGGKPNVSTGGTEKAPAAKPAFSGSIVDYLHQQGIKSNIHNRKNLAVEYGIVENEAQYTGTAKQNTALLNAMMTQKPKQEGTRKEPIQSSYTGNSIVDYLASIKVDNSFASRKRLAKQHLDINNYTGTAKQNKDLLDAMRGSGGKSTKPYNLVEDGYLGPDTVKVLQDYFGLVVDGEIWGQYKGNQAAQAFNQKAVKYGKGGSPVVKVLQKKIGATADGIWGEGTTRALQRYLGTPVDGIISRPSTMVKELQRRLNNGTF